MSHIEIYSTDNCPWCVRAKTLLRARALPYKEIDLSHDPSRMSEMVERSGRRTVPQIFIDGEPVGGFDELSKLDLSAMRA